jgi:hypothetical protein
METISTGEKGQPAASGHPSTRRTSRQYHVATVLVRSCCRRAGAGYGGSTSAGRSGTGAGDGGSASDGESPGLGKGKERERHVGTTGERDKRCRWRSVAVSRLEERKQTNYFFFLNKGRVAKDQERALDSSRNATQAVAGFLHVREKLLDRTALTQREGTRKRSRNPTQSIDLTIADLAWKPTGGPRRGPTPPALTRTPPPEATGGSSPRLAAG